jgi:hypothetical protein
MESFGANCIYIGLGARMLPDVRERLGPVREAPGKD